MIQRNPRLVRVSLAGNRRTDARRVGGESDSSLNCGNDSVMHLAATGNGGNGKGERGRRAILPAASGKVDGLRCSGLNLEPRLAYFHAFTLK